MASRGAGRERQPAGASGFAGTRAGACRQHFAGNGVGIAYPDFRADDRCDRGEQGDTLTQPLGGMFAARMVARRKIAGKISDAEP